MGMDFAYFIARTDADSSEAEMRDGGPLGWPVVRGHKKVGIFRFHHKRL